LSALTAASVSNALRFSRISIRFSAASSEAVIFGYSLRTNQIRPATTTISYTVAGASPPAPSADLSVKLGGAKRVTDGKTFTETITVTNHGPSAATALRATMSIPGAATVAHTGGTRNHGLVHWTDATLAAGRKAHFTVTFRAGRHANRRVTIQASVSDRVSDPDLTDNVAEAGVRLHPKPKPKHRRHKPKHHKPGLVSAQG